MEELLPQHLGIDMKLNRFAQRSQLTGYQVKKPYKCILCKRAFAYAKALKQHTFFLHENKTYLKNACEHCCSFYKTKERLQDHYGKCKMLPPKLEEPDKIVKGKIQNWKLATPPRPEEHNESVVEIKENLHLTKESTSCEIEPPKALLSEVNDKLMEKLLPQHLGIDMKLDRFAQRPQLSGRQVKNPYKCLLCKRKFAHAKSLKQHTYSFHENKSKLKNVCEHCGSFYKTKKRLQDHYGKCKMPPPP